MFAFGFIYHKTVTDAEIPTVTEQYCVRYCENSQINGHGNCACCVFEPSPKNHVELECLLQMILVVQ